MSRIIGFLGVRKYDLILYLSFLLSQCSKKVLIVDADSTSTLSCCIPVPKGLDMESSKITFRDIDYARNIGLGGKEKYDYILINYGIKEKQVECCDALIICLDIQRQHVQEINRLNFKKDKYLLIRDLDYIQDSRRMLKNIKFKVKNIMYLINDEKDRRCRIALQYQEKVPLRRLTRNFKEILETIICDVFGLDKKAYKMAFRSLRKRW